MTVPLPVQAPGAEPAGATIPDDQVPPAPAADTTQALPAVGPPPTETAPFPDPLPEIEDPAGTTPTLEPPPGGTPNAVLADEAADTETTQYIPLKDVAAQIPTTDDHPEAPAAATTAGDEPRTDMAAPETAHAEPAAPWPADTDPLQAADSTPSEATPPLTNTGADGLAEGSAPATDWPTDTDHTRAEELTPAPLAATPPLGDQTGGRADVPDATTDERFAEPAAPTPGVLTDTDPAHTEGLAPAPAEAAPASDEPADAEPVHAEELTSATAVAPVLPEDAAPSSGIDAPKPGDHDRAGGSVVSAETAGAHGEPVGSEEAAAESGGGGDAELAVHGQLHDGVEAGVDDQGADHVVEGLADEVLDPRAGLGTVPIEVADPTPPLGTGADEGGWRELVESVYGPLSEFYEALDARLREVPEDVPPMGWAPHIAAVRALRDGQVAGEWDVLARFLVAPGTLEDAEGLRLVETDEGDEVRVVRDAVKELTAADGRALLIAPTPERAAELLRCVEGDPDVFSLLIETQPATAEARSVRTQALPPVEEPPAEEAPPPLREPGSNGTIEFKPVTGALPEPEAAVTRAEPLPTLPPVEPVEPEEGPSAPEARIRSAALRPVGEAWRLSWQTEARLLQRGLMSLEQWPRDAAALRSVQAENLRRAEQLEAEKGGLARSIEEARHAAATAEAAAVSAEAEAERLSGVQEEAEAELAGPRAEAERLQQAADEAGAEAAALTRTADATYARCVQLDERAKTAQSELQGARQAEASLTDELARAREALPGAAEEAHRLTAADADAAAEGHAAYYRLVSAESALSALRRKMTLGQRLHVASPPSELRGLRAEVKARTREADEAATRAREAKEAAEHADRVRRGLASFVSEGGARLKAAQEAQERLGTELTWLATEREKVGAEHQEQARLASAAVERATEAGLRARAAHQVAQEIAQRAAAARASREAALAAAQRARSDAEAATSHAAEAAAALERRTEEAAQEIAAREAELETVAAAEARSRESVLEICGADPADDPEVVPAHQRRAMARIEELTGYLEGGRAAGGEVLLRTADLVVGTPAGAGLSVRDEDFDVLIVADAGTVTDGEFLVGAVRARRWILVGTAGSRPPGYREYEGSPAGRLELSPFERASTAAPGLVAGPG
ncbi:hypothetical protein [Actinomadura sp. WMMA1423]|uniref:hypothetical protein n=1 Tax=Actinomadura sp. WMMA1423 TaxID=2591108 RepID=UPI001146E913|nr:hypothetical protein [Actinomadura sp. WMMA1423]